VSTSKKRPTGPHELELDLPAADSAERMARRVLRQFALREGVPPAEVETLELVAGELLSNAVDHGGGGAAMEEEDLAERVRMTLRAKIAGGRWELAVDDQGGGEPAHVERLLRPERPPELDDERGRGLYLVATLADDVVVARTQDGRGLSIVARRRYAR
jgi:anti-sigma regulatory factor (Ser/Thr protein kinase)